MPEQPQQTADDHLWNDVSQVIGLYNNGAMSEEQAKRLLRAVVCEYVSQCLESCISVATERTTEK